MSNVNNVDKERERVVCVYRTVHNGHDIKFCVRHNQQGIHSRKDKVSRKVE